MTPSRVEVMRSGSRCSRRARSVFVGVLRLVDELRDLTRRVLGWNAQARREIEEITRVGRIGQFGTRGVPPETTHTSSFELVPTFRAGRILRRVRNRHMGGLTAPQFLSSVTGRAKRFSGYCRRSDTTTLCFTAPLAPVKRKLTKPGASCIVVLTVIVTEPVAGAGSRE